MKPEKALIVFGTRPEFVKLLPIFKAIKANGLEQYFVNVFTGQQPDLMIDLFEKFDFIPHLSLKVAMHKGLANSVSDILSKIQKAIEELSECNNIRLVIGQGDTTSCYSASMAAFMNKIPFAHIEAGLRTHDLGCPFPEEYFRQSISATADIHFAPTLMAFNNLIREGISNERVYLTGNTIIDFIHKFSVKNSSIADSILCQKKTILITCHRRENQTEKFYVLMNAICRLADKYSEFDFIWISHPSPFVKEALSGFFFKNRRNIKVIDPLDIMEMYSLYERTALIITDSGGIQEEAPSFNIPVIVIRDKTERMESVQLEYSIICEMDIYKIDDAFNKLIGIRFEKMNNPYGDGHASERILVHIMRYYFSIELERRTQKLVLK